MTNKFKHKENGKIYSVEKIVHEYGLDIVIYTCDSDTKYSKRRYCRDLYMFLNNMESIGDTK